MKIIYKDKDEEVAIQGGGIVPSLDEIRTIGKKQYKIIEINHEVNRNSKGEYNIFVQVEKQDSMNKYFATIGIIGLISFWAIVLTCRACGMPWWTASWLSGAAGLAIGYTGAYIRKRRRYGKPD